MKEERKMHLDKFDKVVVYIFKRINQLQDDEKMWGVQGNVGMMFRARNQREALEDVIRFIQEINREEKEK